MVDPTRRFSERVASYVRGRPDYPKGLLDTLRDRYGLATGDRIAEIGSGTGILSAQLLGRGLEVIGVEPNAGMRAAAERTLGDGFRSVAGTGEATGLPASSVDAWIAAQAFHWLDPAAARDEARRILRSGGRAFAVWNLRRTTGDPLAEAYEALLQEHGTDYGDVASTWADPDDLAAFFGPDGWTVHRFDHVQVLDREGLVARLVSSSYTPAPGDPRREPMLEALHALFDAHQQQGVVRLRYDTELYAGRPGAGATG